MILNSPTISGSLTVTGNIITSGSITISGSIASASYATNAELLDGLDSTAFATTGAYSATSASLYATSASLSATSGSLSTTSGSLSATSGSLSATSGSLSTASGSFNTRVTALEVTGSALSSSLLTVSGSGYATSGSLSTASGSFDTRVATIESKYATTGSNTFTSTQVVSGSILQSGSFTTTGTIIAQTINVQTVTSSVVYSSGSNVFGNDIGNSQRFTGSVLITGSLTIAGASSATSYSGATIYASTVACSPVGKFTSCIDAGSGTFSGVLTFPANSKMEGSGVPNFILASTSVVGSGVGPYQTFKTNNSDFGYIGSRDALLSTTGNMLSLLGLNGLSLHTGASYCERFSISSTGVATFACQVCSPASIISGTINEQLVLDFVTGAGSYTHQSFRLCGTNQYRLIGDTNGSFILRNDIVSSNVLTFACAGAATFSSTITGTTIYGSTAVCSPVGLFSGCVGIGTTSPAELLEVSGSLKIGNLKIQNSDGGRIGFNRNTATGAIYNCCYAAFQINGAYANSDYLDFQNYNSSGSYIGGFVLNNGNVGIGTSTPVSTNLVGSTTSVKSYNGDTPTSTTAQTYYINQSNLYLFGRNAGLTMVSNANEESVIAFGNPYAYYIGGIRMGMGSGVAGGDLVFQTCGTCERMRITSGGNVGIGSSSPTNVLEIVKAQAATTTLYIENSNDQANAATEIRLVGNEGVAPLKNNIQISFVRGSGGCDWALGMPANSNDFVIGGGTNQGDGKPSLTTAERIRITSAGITCFGYTVCAPCFATISDYRMKSNLRPIEGLSIIMNTKPYKFEYNYDCSTSFGMIAHELQDTVPEAVFGYKDGEVMQGVDYMKLLPIAIKAIQELKAENDIFKTCLGIS